MAGEAPNYRGRQAAARIHCVVLTCKISRVDILLPNSSIPPDRPQRRRSRCLLSPFVVVDVEFRDFITRYCPRFSNATHAPLHSHLEQGGRQPRRETGRGQNRRSAAGDLYTLSSPSPSPPWPLFILRCRCGRSVPSPPPPQHSSLSAIHLGSGGTMATCFLGLPDDAAVPSWSPAFPPFDLGSLFTCNQKRGRR